MVSTLNYETRPRSSRPAWGRPPWQLALAWLPFCLVAGLAGAYGAGVVFWEGEFWPGAWPVVPGRVAVGGGLAAVATSPALALARLGAGAKLAIGGLVALVVTFVLTFVRLFDLWGP